jgi:gas vesicle protein
MKVQGKDIMDAIKSNKEINEETENKLKKAIENFVQSVN